MQAKSLAVNKSPRQAKQPKTISINDITGKVKRKTAIFFNRIIKRNKVVQVMVIGAQGRSELWDGNLNGAAVRLDVDNTKDIFNIVELFRKKTMKYEGVFFSLHKPNNEYIEKVNKRFSSSGLVKGGSFLTDKDIEWLSYIYVDIDPKSKKKPVPSGINEKCKAVRDEIDTDLVSSGFPESIRLNSGNGASLLIPVKGFRNTPETLAKVKSLLEYLSIKYDNDHVKIDNQVFNPARSFRMPYTINGKKSGDSTVKNRYAGIDYIPKTSEPLEYLKFKEIAEKLGFGAEPEKITEVQKKRKMNIQKYLGHYHRKIIKVKNQGGATLYCLDKCVFDPGHTPSKASIVQQPDGKLSYQCFHDSCSGKTWADARAKISGTDKLKDFIDGSAGSGQTSDNRFEDIRIVQMAEVMAYNHTSTPYIKDILDKGEALLLLGSSGVGKSLVTLFISLLGASKQKPIWNISAFEIRKPFSTLFVQSENNIAHTSSRLRKMFKLYPDFKEGCNRISLLGRGSDCMVTGELSDSKFQGKLRDGIIEANADVVIVDPFICFHNKNENDNGEIRKELDCLKRVCDDTYSSVILVHHIAKSHTAENKGGRGASAIADWADRIIFLERESKGDKDCLKVTCQKSRNEAMFKPFYVDITDFKFERVTEVGDEKTDAVIKALDELGGTAKTQDALAAQIRILSGVSESTAKRSIKQAVEAGLIEMTGKGKSKTYKSLEETDED